MDHGRWNKSLRFLPVFFFFHFISYYSESQAQCKCKYIWISIRIWLNPFYAFCLHKEEEILWTYKRINKLNLLGSKRTFSQIKSSVFQIAMFVPFCADDIKIHLLTSDSYWGDYIYITKFWLITVLSIQDLCSCWVFSSIPNFELSEGSYYTRELSLLSKIIEMWTNYEMVDWLWTASLHLLVFII